MKNLFFEEIGDKNTSHEEMKKNLIRILLKNGFKKGSCKVPNIDKFKVI